MSLPPSTPEQTDTLKASRDLQWSEVLEHLARRCHSDAARARLLSAHPYDNQERAELAQTQLTEALDLVNHSAPLPIRAVPAVSELCAALIRQAVGTKEQFRDLSRTLEQAGRIRDHLSHKAERCPVLKATLWSAPELDALRRRIEQTIDEHGEIRDSASVGLANARRSLRTFREHLKSAVSKLLSKYQGALSGSYFADRDGRCVLPVRTDAQSQVEGMVLGVSGSGGTLYVEPRELNDLNNRLQIAEAAVIREEAKVLMDLSAEAADHASSIASAYESCIEADRIAALANWANQYGAHPVVFAESPLLELLQFRHPLLLGQDIPIVANDIQLRAGQCLIISGPNAGGKTVALKCLGLAVWMARAGLPVPADPKSRIGWFGQVLTDIGDDQSMSRSLSTFSAHISNLARCLEQSERGTLVLLDEVAGGTDPDEGSALAESLLVGFVEREAAVAATTHYERLKALGAREDDSYLNASVGFDMARMLPTFRLTLGIPGASSAFAVARRYGIPESLVARAQAFIPKTQLERQHILEQIETERQKLTQLREQAETELHAQRHLSQQLASEKRRAFEQEKERLRKDALVLTEELKASRVILRRVQLELESKPTTRADLRALERFIGEAAQPVTTGGALSQALQQISNDESCPLPGSIKPGMVVYIHHLQADAEVLEAPVKGQVRVRVGVMKMSVPLERLRLRKGRGPRPPQPGGSSRKVRTHMNSVTARPAAVRTQQNVCDLRGVRVEAGLEQVEQFLDEMLQQGESAAFILHGHGTGAMKAAVRDHVAGLSHVEHWEPAAKEEGGDAFTVCWLRE